MQSMQMLADTERYLLGKKDVNNAVENNRLVSKLLDKITYENFVIL